MRPIGLYIHIPFCRQKCAYCDFYSIPGGDAELQERYVNALLMQMDTLSSMMEDRVFDTVYLGGGTPGLLPAELLCKLLEGIKTVFHIAPDAEITLETNPAVADEDKLIALRAAGYNRLSMGMQTADPALLHKLGRLHSPDEFEETFLAARRAGFANLSADVMYALPGQMVDGLLQTLRTLIALSPEHISMYGLKVEENTPFGRLGDKLTLPDEDTQCEMYERACALLQSAGYPRYEISNFAKPGYESRHNLRYWRRGEYLGLGPAAHSFVDGVRYSYPRALKDYIRTIEEGSAPAPDSFVRLTEADAVEEAIMLGLRLEEGIPLTEALTERTAPYIRHGFMERRGDRIAFTTKGFLVSNTILAEII